MAEIKAANPGISQEDQVKLLQLEKSRQIPVKAGNLIRYILPSKIEISKPALLSLRPVKPAENVVLYVNSGDEQIYKRKFPRIVPSEMIRIPIEKVPDCDSELVVNLEPETR